MKRLQPLIHPKSDIELNFGHASIFGLNVLHAILTALGIAQVLGFPAVSLDIHTFQFILYLNIFTLNRVFYSMGSHSTCNI